LVKAVGIFGPYPTSKEARIMGWFRDFMDAGAYIMYGVGQEGATGEGDTARRRTKLPYR
jgi:hypothetical protein